METINKRKSVSKIPAFDSKLCEQIISASWENAMQLKEEGDILFLNEKYARSFALHFFSLEEIGKRLLFCDYCEGMVSDKECNDSLHKHNMKIAYLSNNCHLEHLAGGGIQATITYNLERAYELFQNRQKALYVDVENGQVFTPLEIITKEDALAIKSHLEKVIRDTLEYEYITERRGSKAFYK